MLFQLDARFSEQVTPVFTQIFSIGVLKTQEEANSADIAELCKFYICDPRSVVEAQVVRTIRSSAAKDRGVGRRKK